MERAGREGVRGTLLQQPVEDSVLKTVCTAFEGVLT